MKDYYKILGVAETATADQIKAAFRKLAVQYHPDRNPQPEAENVFKEANEAYEVLGSEAKRQEYDQQRRFGHAQASAGFGAGNFHFHTNFDGNINDIFSTIFGQGFGPFQRPVRNQDVHVQIEVTLEEVFQGKSIPVQFTDSSGKPVNLTVNVPKGIDHGTRLRYAGNGSRINPSLPPGDLMITIVVQPHPVFERNGPHLIYNLEVSLWESLLGCTKSVPSIDGKNIMVTVPRLCEDQTLLKIANRGLWQKSDVKTRGDLLVRAVIKWPEGLTDSQEAAIRSWVK
jgi:curved DNA-binding protein